MVNIRVSDFVDLALDYADGQLIYDLIEREILSNRKVVVSFEGITAVPSAFVNAAFVQLLEVASMDQIRANLKIVDSTKYINDLIKSRFEFSERSSRGGSSGSNGLGDN